MAVTNTDLLYTSTKKHFRDLIMKYGSEIFCVNLLKTDKAEREREGILTDKYKEALSFINKEIHPQGHQITFTHLDVKGLLRRDAEDFTSKATKVSQSAWEKTGMFIYSDDLDKQESTYIRFQQGVLRSNCVDCLDRTNLMQMIANEIILPKQITKLLNLEEISVIELADSVLDEFRSVSTRMGDFISLQYGGSAAHRQKLYKIRGKHTFDIVTSVHRHFSNAVSDKSKQLQNDLFIGAYLPRQKDAIWDAPIALIHYPSKEVEEEIIGEDWLRQGLSYYTMRIRHLTELMNFKGSIDYKDKSSVMIMQAEVFINDRSIKEQLDFPIEMNPRPTSTMLGSIIPNFLMVNQGFVKQKTTNPQNQMSDLLSNKQVFAFVVPSQNLAPFLKINKQYSGFHVKPKEKLLWKKYKKNKKDSFQPIVVENSLPPVEEDISARLTARITHTTVTDECKFIIDEKIEEDENYPDFKKYFEFPKGFDSVLHKKAEKEKKDLTIPFEYFKDYQNKFWKSDEECMDLAKEQIESYWKVGENEQKPDDEMSLPFFWVPMISSPEKVNPGEKNGHHFDFMNQGNKNLTNEELLKTIIKQITPYPIRDKLINT